MTILIAVLGALGTLIGAILYGRSMGTEAARKQADATKAKITERLRAVDQKAAVVRQTEVAQHAQEAVKELAGLDPLEPFDEAGAAAEAARMGIKR